MGLTEAGLKSGVILFSSGRNSGILLYFNLDLQGCSCINQ